MTEPQKASDVEASDGLTDEQRTRREAAAKAAATRARTKALREVGSFRGFGDGGLHAKLDKSRQTGEERMKAFRERNFKSKGGG
jgi:hypothetical protein